MIDQLPLVSVPDATTATQFGDEAQSTHTQRNDVSLFVTLPIPKFGRTTECTVCFDATFRVEYSLRCTIPLLSVVYPYARMSLQPLLRNHMRARMSLQPLLRNHMH